MLFFTDIDFLFYIVQVWKLKEINCGLRRKKHDGKNLLKLQREKKRKKIQKNNAKRDSLV
jgi:hypothetical protein